MSNKPNNQGQSRTGAKHSFASARDITERKQLEAVRQEALDRFQKITQLMPGIVYQFRLRPDGSTCVPYASEATREIYRLSPEDIREDASRIFTHVHPDDLENYLASIQTSARDLTPWQHEYRLKFDDGTVRWLFGNSLPQREADGSTLWHGFITDITERKQLETMLRKRTDELALHNRVLQQISLGAPLCEVLEELARQVEALHPGMLCSILLVAEDGRHLRHGAAPGLPDFYNQAVNGLAIGDGMGACGTAAYRGERVIVEDVQQHAYWPGPYRDLARRADVQSCWSQPIKDSNGRVLGTFAIYHQKPALPSDTEIALIERYADLTALVIERIRIQDDLRESEEQFRQLAENIREAFWMTDPAKNKMLYISPAYEQIWGRTLQSLYDSPMAWLEAIHGEDRQRVLQAALDKQATGLYDEEYRIVRPNGDVRWIHDRAFPVRDSGGSVYRIVGVAEDITGRKQAEAALRESEANIRTILDNMQDLFYRTDQYGQITMVSASVKAVLGYEQEDVVGRQVTDLYADPDARGKLLEKLEEGGGMVQGYEIVLRHKDGNLVWVSTNSHFYWDKNGNVAGVEGVGRDITGRKQAEAALHESEANMRAILDNSPYMVWLKDTWGRYIKVNKGYADYLRLKDARQIIGKTDFDLWPKELAEKYRADDAEVMATLQQKYIEEQSLDGDRMHWVETFKTPILDESGNVLGTTGFAHDITGRKQAEEQIYQLAFYDLLTGLPNRRLLNDRLGQTLAASKRSDHYGALMFMDLDNFKPLNDTHGHGVGDLLLIEVARRITSCVREVDTVARFGGDEFVVILSELDADKTGSLAQAGIVAEKIRAILAEPYVLTIPQEGKAGTITVEHRCTSSIGVVLFVGYESGAEDILKWADMAMYQAKEGGRNLIRFFDLPHYL